MRHLPLLLLLAGCGDPNTKPWAGNCAAPNGDIGLSTGELTQSTGSAPQWEGEHTYYTGSGSLVFPESEQDVSVGLVLCDDPDGCEAPTADYAEGDLIVTFRDSSDNVRLTGWGVLEGREVAGQCTSAFGPGDFTFGKE